MAGKDIIKLSQEEAKRLCVIQKALSREINQVKAAEILSLSDRQISLSSRKRGRDYY